MSNPHLDNHSSTQQQQLKMNFNPFPQAATTNYAGIVASVLIQFGMGPLQGNMADGSNLQKSQTDMSCKYTNLSEFLSSLEGQDTASASNPSVTSIEEFVEQFKGIYCSDGANPTYANLPPVLFHGQPISPALMNLFWTQAEAEASLQTGGQMDPNSWIFQIAGNSSTLPVSDLQMYVLWKLQTKLDALPASASINSVTDLLNAYDPDSSSSNSTPDPVISGALNLLNSSNMGTKLDNVNRSLLSDVINDNMTNLQADFVQLEEGYYNHAHSNSNPPNDQLKPIATQVNTTQTVLGAQSQQETTTIQQDVAEITSYDNTGQNIIQNSDIPNTVKNIIPK